MPVHNGVEILLALNPLMIDPPDIPEEPERPAPPQPQTESEMDGGGPPRKTAIGTTGPRPRDPRRGLDVEKLLQKKKEFDKRPKRHEYIVFAREATKVHLNNSASLTSTMRLLQRSPSAYQQGALSGWSWCTFRATRGLRKSGVEGFRVHTAPARNN